MPFPFTREHREKRFWRWFETNSGRLLQFDEHQEALAAELTAQLHRVQKRLCFEFGPTVQGRREFIVSADGIRDAFPAVRSLVAAAPPLPDWRVIPFRPPKGYDLKLSFGDLELCADDVWFEAFRDGDHVAFVLYLRGLTKEREEVFGHAAFILLDSALGEYAVETRVSGIDFRPLPDDPEAHQLTPFREIGRVIDTRAH